jgi:hypothetical protein
MLFKVKVQGQSYRIYGSPRTTSCGKLIFFIAVIERSDRHPIEMEEYEAIHVRAALEADHILHQQLRDERMMAELDCRFESMVEGGRCHTL